jgi:hypothetical protein
LVYKIFTENRQLMVAPAPKRKNKTGANVLSNATNSSCFSYRSCLVICFVGIIVSIVWVTFYTSTEVDNLSPYDERINNFTLTTELLKETPLKEYVGDTKYHENIYDTTLFDTLDVTEEEMQKSFDYINSFTEESFERLLTFFHIPKTAGTAIEHAAGTSNRNLSWGSCMFNHGSNG